MESAGLLEMAGETIARPVIRAMADRGILRPCILYPGCFVSMDGGGRPTRIRVSEINIRPGEPEAQPVARRLRNLGRLIEATMEGELDQVAPEVREEQVSLCIALVTGPGGPDGQKGYPWSCTKGEPVDLDFKYMKRKGIQVIPSAMDWDEDHRALRSDGTRVAFLNANATIKEGERRGEVADRLRKKLLAAFDNGKVRVIPREDPEGNRLDLRRDIGRHYLTAEEIFQR
jgi:phosphoribosylamine--glycine ligase